MRECAICGMSIDDEEGVIYDGDECHIKCALEDQDACGMDAEFGDSS